jgi:hypothetical protein
MPKLTVPTVPMPVLRGVSVSDGRQTNGEHELKHARYYREADNE